MPPAWGGHVPKTWPRRIEFSRIQFKGAVALAREVSVVVAPRTALPDLLPRVPRSGHRVGRGPTQTAAHLFSDPRRMDFSGTTPTPRLRTSNTIPPGATRAVLGMPKDRNRFYLFYQYRTCPVLRSPFYVLRERQRLHCDFNRMNNRRNRSQQAARHRRKLESKLLRRARRYSASPDH